MPSILKKYLLSLSAALLVFGLTACNESANSEPSGAAKDESAEKVNGGSSDKLAAFKEKFAKARADLVVTDVVESEVAGIYKVVFDGKGHVYADEAGDFFFVGDLYQVEKNRIVNVTEMQANGPRAELLSKVSRDDMIIFSPEGEVKASVVVFTDVDCGYCRKLHNEVPKMNELGIEIKYLAYPRAGIGSPSYRKIASAWCADDPRDAITKLKSGIEIPTNVCEGNPVANQFNIGIQSGLSGTPAIVLESGELIPGYMPAAKLAKTIGI